MKDAKLETGLLRLAELMKDEVEPWWIIGSTAMVLLGVEGVEPEDIDVVANGTMLRRVLAKAGVSETTSKPHEKFRSTPYTRIKVDDGLDIEMQGDLELWENDGWTRLTIASRIEVQVIEATVYVPSLDEQLSILQRFGRPKDLEKVTLLNAFFKQRET